MKKQSTTITAKYAPEIVNMMNETTHCLCCRVKLRYLDKEKARNRGYCSLRCFYTLPPRYAYIERIYGIKAIDFVKKELNRTDNVETVAGLIGVYKQSLYEFIKKHRIHRVVRWEG